MLSCSLIRRAALCGALFIPFALCAQTGQTATPEQAPKTAPQVQEVLPSYEGQNVTSLELAGRPDLNIQSLLPLLSQRAGEPFSLRMPRSVAQKGHFGKLARHQPAHAGPLRVGLVHF